MVFPQYQHFIPQFLLRRFAVDQTTSPPTVSSLDRKRQQSTRKYTALVKVVNLDKNPPDITHELVRKTFGQHDMYNGYHGSSVEKRLGNIEQAASRIIARVVVAHERGDEGISLSRSDTNILRKFQFVMKYRGPLFFNRFNHKTAEAYSSNDRDPFLKYMRTKNFESPLEVWLDNLTKIIDIPMDPNGGWTMKLAENIYPRDALWLMTYVLCMHLAFVTPSDPEEEFILSENAFGIYEGPSSTFVDRFTGKETGTVSTEFHVLMVISPRLAIVLRDNYMPAPLEDMDPKVRRQKSDMLAEHAQKHVDPEHATSLLQDLPIEKARCSYNTSMDGKRSVDDEFSFTFYRLNSRHVQTINLVILDQAHNVNKLVFKSEPALRKALEFYLDYPCLTKGLHSVKTISSRIDDPKLRLLQKLEHLAQSLGSDVRAKFHVDLLWQEDGAMHIDDAVAQVLETTTPIKPYNPYAWPMRFLVEVLAEMKIDIRWSYAIHNLLQKHDWPSYPESVYAAIQKAERRRPSLRSKLLLQRDRWIWVDGWDGFVEKSRQEGGAYLNVTIADIRGRMSQPNHDSSFETTQRAAPITKPIAGLSAHAKKSRRGSQLGFSRRGLSKAFDDIGRDMEIEKTRSPSITQSATHHLCPFPRSGVHENKEETQLAYSSEGTETESMASFDTTAVISGPLADTGYSTTGPPFWILAILSVVLWWLASCTGLLSDELP